MQLNPDAAFWWVYGADSIETIDLWGGEWLKAHTNILIALRDGATINEIPAKSEIMTVDTSGLPSSTDVRTMITQGESYQNAVPQEVAKVIDRSLYQQS